MKPKLLRKRRVQMKHEFLRRFLFRLQHKWKSMQMSRNSIILKVQILLQSIMHPGFLLKHKYFALLYYFYQL